MIAAADLREIILHLSGILEAIEKLWNMGSNQKPDSYQIWEKMDELDSQAIDSSQQTQVAPSQPPQETRGRIKLTPLQLPPLPPFPFYPYRSASPSSSMDQMMGSEAMKFKDNLPAELKPE
ncbi:hypothetical protein AVEN_4192-1 [Araneus ventricosus]|uniref:Uncharacterized protein n=1 Tax=Araneus ventricosus TaxID=182803 RepID=A0A4Y2FAX0_ARAVE|nr:hypothetical protein AVEN_4192-1 [Araneus ventricosus]